MTLSLVGSVLGMGFLFAGPLAAQAPGKVDFRRDIRPIFQDHCIGCHGPSQQMGAMRLDQRSSAMGIRSGTTIGPGNADGSKLYLKLIGTKYGGRMPPTGPLSPEQIDLIKAWIDQGAEWPDDLAGDKAPTIPDLRSARIMEALRAGDGQKFAKFLRDDPDAIKLKGPGGSTPLMFAALYGDAAACGQLIEHGADVNASNDAGATALMWAIEDPDKVRLLLVHGADANAMSVDSRTPLSIALGNMGSAAVVKLLLDHGANLDAKNYRGRSLFAGAGGDEAVLHILIEHGVDLPRLSPALGAALGSNCLACVNMLAPSAPKLGSSLIFAAADRDDRAFKILLHNGADAKTADPGLGFTALMYAANSELDPVEKVKSLIERGADVNARTTDGSTALDFALRSGDASVVEVLRKAGAKEGDAPSPPVLKPKPAASVEAAIERSIPLLQRSDVAFIRKSGCVSCHNNNLTAMTMAAARKQGVRVDENIARAQVKAIAAYVEGNRERYLQGVSIAGQGDTTGYILLGMAAESWPSDPATDAMARFLKDRQGADGTWPSFGGRPPIESSDIQSTATAMRAIQIYMPKARHAEYERSVRLAAEWIAKAQPLTTEDRVFQLFGLIWAGQQEMARLSGRILLQEQRSDGGWGQTSSLASDSYATGQALVALNEAGVLMPSDAPYKRGAQFLLNTQLEDGSWYVRSRTIPFQPYFDGGFPHGPDQFISAAATNWATMALIRVRGAAYSLRSASIGSSDAARRPGK
jgi:ankyrin repeat protein